MEIEEAQARTRIVTTEADADTNFGHVNFDRIQGYVTKANLDLEARFGLYDHEQQRHTSPDRGLSFAVIRSYYAFLAELRPGDALEIRSRYEIHPERNYWILSRHEIYQGEQQVGLGLLTHMFQGRSEQGKAYAAPKETIKLKKRLFGEA